MFLSYHSDDGATTDEETFLCGDRHLQFGVVKLSLRDDILKVCIVHWITIVFDGNRLALGLL